MTAKDDITQLAWLHTEYVAVSAWLHAELAYHHDQLAAEHMALVKQIQAMIQQLVGPAAAANPAHAQAIRARAARIAALRANPTTPGQR